MYQNYQARQRPSLKVRLFRASLIVLGAVLLATAIIVFLRWGKVAQPIANVNGVQQVSTVQGEHLAVYDGTGWKSQFWNGMNLGASLPGHSPGELAPTEEDYLRWFAEMKEMNVDVVRVYTILSPEFYRAFHKFNANREDPLWLIQGVWTPEEELIGKDEEGKDAYTKEITSEFRGEIQDAVQAVHGDADLPKRPGHASGRFRADVSEYMLGWMVGTEWYPYAVRATNRAHPDMKTYSGTYFRGTPEASPFEGWLAWMLDTLAEEEMKYGWQHPVSFTNWPTTDPLSHPNESLEQEDLVPVDPMHVEPTKDWSAGYFSQYHVYPYYPDFLRYQPEYQSFRTKDGKKDPYAAYLNDLRDHHKGIPLMIGEFGVPSSRGMAHHGPLGRDQGYHTEKEQGAMDADMLKIIREQGFDGGILFEWTDEWFKFTWNTIELELPGTRRDMWRNRLTNEEHFGVISTEAGQSAKKTIQVDGKTSDWDRRAGGGVGGFFGRLSDRFAGKASTSVTDGVYKDFDLSIAHDEAYLYMLLKKRDGEWSFPEDEVNVGFGTLGDGAPSSDLAPGLDFPYGGTQFLMQIKGEDDARIEVNSAYDQHTWLYANQLDLRPAPKASQKASAGDFLPWNLALNRGLYLPQTEQKVPFEEIDVGRLRRGISDPESSEFYSLSDWYAKGDVLEVRIPWMLLGFTDPSSKRVWDYPYKAGKLEPVKVENLRVYPDVRASGDTGEQEIKPLSYVWNGWDETTYHERKKKGYGILREAFTRKELETP